MEKVIEVKLGNTTSAEKAEKVVDKICDALDENKIPILDGMRILACLIAASVNTINKEIEMSIFEGYENDKKFFEACSLFAQRLKEIKALKEENMIDEVRTIQ